MIHVIICDINAARPSIEYEAQFNIYKIFISSSLEEPSVLSIISNHC